ncbi:MAG TPA: hypothetical protein VMT43_06100, partial [Acidimicrobiales bacterium]|nr:hypothetical protein [Acidimicrobiales bacterium]
LRLHADGELLDPTVGLDLPAGCSTLDGRTVVALARSRHLESRNPSTGVVTLDQSADLGREYRQRVLLEAIWQELRGMPDDLHSLTTLVDVFADHTTIDAGFSRSELVSLLRWGRTLNEAYSMLLPVFPFVSPEGADVLTLDPARAPSVIDTYLGGDAPTGATATTAPHGADPSPSTIGLTSC